MFNSDKDTPRTKRGVTKTRCRTANDARVVPLKTARMLLTAILSMTLAVSPLGLTAFASQSTADNPQDPEELNNNTNSENSLAINPGNIELVVDDTYHWPNLTIDAKESDRLIHSSTIQFTSAIEDGDSINVIANGDFTILDADTPGSKTVNNANGATAAEWQEYLRNNLTMKLAGEDRTADVRFTLSYLSKDRTIYYFKDTGHYYERVFSPGVYQGTAYVSARKSSYNGMQGYLAAITSKEEDDFVFSILGDIRAWIGATGTSSLTTKWLGDAAYKVPRIYLWADGPEAGTQLPYNNGEDVYTNWCDIPSINFSSNTGVYIQKRYHGWLNGFDISDSYIVEYGGMPEDDVDAASQDDAYVDITVDLNEADNAQDGTEKQLSIDPGKPVFTGTSSSILNCRWPNLTISTKDPNELIRSVTIQLTTVADWNDGFYIGYKPGFKDGPDSGGNLTINGAATADVWQQYLRTSLYAQFANTGVIRDIRFTLSSSSTDRVVNYSKDTDHYYESIYKTGAGSITWQSALERAAKAQYKGMQGYLATSTSAEENLFIRKYEISHGWIGATCDPAYVNKWFPDATMDNRVYAWVSGPEAGTQIPTTNDDAEYACWKNGKAGGNLPENLLHMYPFVFTWNVETNGGSWDIEKRNGMWSGFVIEYGGMPGDDMVISSDEASIDVALDPSGKTLSTSLESNRIEFGDTLKISENINGEAVPEDLKITHTFYVKDEEQEDGWRKLDDSELGANGTPSNTGNYKVESHATYTDDEGNEQQYNPGFAKFTIVPKSIDLTNAGPVAIKEYDGTDTFDLSNASLPSGLIGDLDIELGAQLVSVGGDDGASAGDKTLVLDGSSLKGSDADKYKLKVKVQILPRKLVVSTDANIKKGYANSALKASDGKGLELSTNLAVRSADSDGAWLENELAPCDGSLGEDGTLATILGDEALVAKDGDKVLDPDKPEKGAYSVEAHYANVNPIEGNGAAGVVAAAARMVDSSNASARLLSVEKVNDHTYDIGNYILTIKPATIAIASRSAGNAGDGGSNDPGVENPGVTFAPIDATTDIRIDPSATGTVGGDPYFEHDSDKPVNVLDMIQVRPEGADDWEDWMGGSGSGSGDSNDPDGSNPTNPGNPNDPGDSGSTNPDGSDASDDGSGNGSGSGDGDAPDGTTPQLPDDVKVTVTDEAGRPVDPTSVTDPGTYEVTVSVKDPDTDEFVVVKTLTFHVVDTSITDTDYIYKDVPKDHWGRDYIFDIGPSVINGAFNPSDVALGYMAGYAGTTDFGPHHGIIRGDAAIVIWRMAGCPDVEGDGNDPDSPKLLSLANAHYTGFADCDANPTAYYNKAIRWCASNGIVTGYGDTGLYLPQNQITREEFASIIARYAAFKGKDVSSASADLTQYPDIQDVSDWAAPNMHYVVANGIMTGKGTDEGTALGTHGILDPQAHVTRAEVAKMTYMEQPYRLLP